MSFKDVRDLSEHLKLLGYSNQFPLQALYSNYGSLNSFKVVADILQWLAGRLEPGTVLPGGTETESDRVLLIRSATEFFVTKSAIKLNPRKLYASSSAAAKELQKITSILMQTPNENDENEDENYKSLALVDLGDKIDDLRRARELSSELTNGGASLYDLLSKELINKETRMLQSSRSMEIATVEKALKNTITALQNKLHSAKSQLEQARVEKNALNSKLQRKKAELDRTKQRLDALQKIRPAYLEEFEQLEEELRGLFQQYFIRIQCRDALRAQLAARTKLTTPLSSPISNKPAESSMNFITEGLIDDDDENEDDIDNDDEILGPGIPSEEYSRNRDNSVTTDSPRIVESREVPRVRPTTGRFKPRTGTEAGRRNVVGSMLGGEDDDPLDSTLGSGESDSEIDLGAHGYDLASDDDISLSKLTGENLIINKKQNKLSENASDEDF
ncbi:clusterin-associated protein 1 [Condylostylus longicornis]|uniref:clusterin-associated protein 1 n=1 Tax=Condylostylus longicornis TaxID=2530218 RepID=UPI00244DF914|nr:clusterin-associated protein 1 [Condylostylus longicornis]